VDIEDSLAARQLFDREIAPETLAEWTAQTAAPKPAAQTRPAGALLVRAGSEWFGLPTGVVDCALPVGPVHSVPSLGSPAFLGLANVDGELLPCVSLADLAGADTARAAPTPGPAPLRARGRLIAVTVAQGRFALLVDEAAGSCGFAPEALTPPPDTVARSPRPLVTGMATLEGRLTGIVDPESLGRALLRSLRP
jgi:chemotaxis-related protein WspD